MRRTSCGALARLVRRDDAPAGGLRLAPAKAGHQDGSVRWTQAAHNGQRLLAHRSCHTVRFRVPCQKWTAATTMARTSRTWTTLPTMFNTNPPIQSNKMIPAIANNMIYAPADVLSLGDKGPQTAMFTWQEVCPLLLPPLSRRAAASKRLR